MTLINTVHGATRARKQQEPRPLRIVIIGAGIGGLTAAIALRSQGHEVTVSFHVSDIATTSR